MKRYHGSKAGIAGAIAPTSRGCSDYECAVLNFRRRG